MVKINLFILFFKETVWELGIGTHTYNPRAQEPETGGLRVWEHHGLQSETLSLFPSPAKYSFNILVSLHNTCKYEFAFWDRILL